MKNIIGHTINFSIIILLLIFVISLNYNVIENENKIILLIDQCETLKEKQDNSLIELMSQLKKKKKTKIIYKESALAKMIQKKIKKWNKLVKE